MAEGATSESRIARPSLRGAQSAAANLADIEDMLKQVERIGADIDEARVQRAFRHWIDWIRERQRAPLLIALAAGDALEAIAPGLAAAVAPIGDAIVEVHPRNLRSEAMPWPAIVGESGTKHRILVIRDAAGLAQNWQAAAYLRRDCTALLLTGDADISGAPAGLFDALPMGVIQVARGDAAPGPLLRARRVPVAAEADLAAILAAAIPTAIQPSLRALVLAEDTAYLAARLQREEGAGRSSDEQSTSEAARTARGEEERIAAEIEAIATARTELAADLKTLLASLRQARSEVDPAALLESGTPQSFATLVQRLETVADAERHELVDEQPRRTWWRETPFRFLPIFFSEKSDAQLKPEVLEHTLRDVQRATLRQIGRTIANSVAEFNEVLRDSRITFETASPGAAAIVQNHLLERTYFDSFQIDRAPPPGGARPDSQLARQVKEAADTAFGAFVQAEIRAFRIERERKGFLGRLTEARSAIFGLYFLLLMAVRLVPQGSLCVMQDPPKPLPQHYVAVPKQGYEILCAIEHGLNGWLRWALIGLILIGLFFNVYSAPHKERASFADKVETKLEELRTRIATFLDRLIKEQLGLVEARLNDQAEAVDSALGRLHSSLRTRLELLRGVPAATSARESLAPSRPSGIDANARRLAIKVRTEFAAEIAAATPAGAN